MIILAVDPGTTGIKGAFAIYNSGSIDDYKVLPTKGKLLDVKVVKKFLEESSFDICVIEQVMKSGAGLSNQNVGRLKAVLELLSHKYVEIHPKTWQKVVKNRLNIPGSERYQKEYSVEYCSDVLGFSVPKNSRRKNAAFQHGIADACCLAEIYANHLRQ